MSIERRYALIKHTHLLSDLTGGLINLTTGSPTLRLIEEDSSGDPEAIYDLNVDGQDFKLRVQATDLSSAADVLVVNTTGTHVDAIQFYGDVQLMAGYLAIPDGLTAPGAIPGRALLYVDSADGDLKVKFEDGTVKTIVTDT